MPTYRNGILKIKKRQNLSYGLLGIACLFLVASLFLLTVVVSGTQTPYSWWQLSAAGMGLLALTKVMLFAAKRVHEKNLEALKLLTKEIHIL